MQSSFSPVTDVKHKRKREREKRIYEFVLRSTSVHAHSLLLFRSPPLSALTAPQNGINKRIDDSRAYVRKGSEAEKIFSKGLIW